MFWFVGSSNLRNFVVLVEEIEDEKNMGESMWRDASRNEAEKVDNKHLYPSSSTSNTIEERLIGDNALILKIRV